MFADISGFTNLTESLSKLGHEGAEIIAFALNRYTELLVSAIGRSGGDVFKFAGGLRSKSIIRCYHCGLASIGKTQRSHLR
jgi:hypothetical protein